jgi:Mn2+/Fe2+ NRAMP family transporter
LAAVLSDRLGDGARRLFAIGLCAAGVSSAITAPIAAAITARSLFSPSESEDGGEAEAWGERGWKFRSVWLAVLGVGVAFGVAEVKPIPAILLAQALNGILLPFIAVFLLLSVNDRRLVGRDGLNGSRANVALGAVVAITVMLGLNNIAKAMVGAFGWTPPGERLLLFSSIVLAAVGAVPVWRRARRLREKR